MQKNNSSLVRFLICKTVNLILFTCCTLCTNPYLIKYLLLVIIVLRSCQMQSEHCPQRPMELCRSGCPMGAFVVRPNQQDPHQTPRSIAGYREQSERVECVRIQIALNPSSQPPLFFSSSSSEPTSGPPPPSPLPIRPLALGVGVQRALITRARVRPCSNLHRTVMRNISTSRRATPAVVTRCVAAPQSTRCVRACKTRMSANMRASVRACALARSILLLHCTGAPVNV